MLRLLIVDDETAIRTGISAYFPWASLGIEVAATARDGAEALQIMEKESIDLVLCDIRMPRMDGIEFAALVRERGYPCEIVFISAHKDFDYAKRAIELGVREYIVKPAGYEELSEAFTRIVGERAAREAAPGADPQASSELAGRVSRIMDRDLSGACLPAVAARLSMSPNYLSAKLQKETGKTFSHFLAEARMERARILLSDPANRVGQISALVGYANPKSFIRAFRQHFGESPTSYRFGLRSPDGGKA